MVKWEQVISSGVMKSVSKAKKKKCVVNDGWREKKEEEKIVTTFTSMVHIIL